MTEAPVAFAFPRERPQAKLAAARSYPARVARQVALALQRRVDRGEFVDHALGGHPKPATDGRLKTGHHE